METNDEQSQAKEELDEYVVTLRFFGDDLDPDEISQLLGSAPTASARRGDIRQGKVRSYTAKTGSWRFSTDHSTKDIEEQFTQDAQIPPEDYYPPEYKPELLFTWPSDKPIYVPWYVLPDEKMLKKPLEEKKP